MITYVQLRCFLAVAEDMNFRRAAERLNMTQPPLTRHIQALEHAVGVSLLDRGTRKVALTAAGAAFARSARLIVGQTNAAILDARRIASGDQGAITIGFTATSSYRFLPRFVQWLQERMPGVALSLREMTSAEQRAALRLQQIDIGLSRPPMHAPGLQTRLVFREPLVVALPRRHRLAGRQELTIHDLTDENLITYPPVEGVYFHDLIEGVLNANHVRVAQTQHVTQAHSILALVGAGMGVALVPRSAESIHFADVIFLPLTGPGAAEAELVLVWRDPSNNPASDAAIAHLEGFDGQTGAFADDR
ncbi:LysR family transcriptional regulator [Burkholderia sp. Ac-20379]|uniref:LysR family transcriptional regulator n=1 Tax=Burkholderia sp. Ac-20379 TaxID=2703900 RepID=UPI00197F7D16|nr:LysR family transcriptional regulator [Burkholderia sp. Ac-20379]MBN3727584.1 LysR family transcriptional regulator [Burkholderia sp. Ac-20379]